jgi:hypothetical protein
VTLRKKMENKKIPVKTEFPPTNLEKSQKADMSKEDLQRLMLELEKKFLIKVTYDLLQVPGYIDDGEQLDIPPGDRIQQEEDEGEEEVPPKRKLTPVTAFPVPKRPRKTKYTGRGKAQNPAPNSKGFKPDWYDIGSGLELALANYTPLVEEKKRMNRSAIVFWARAKGKLPDGRDRQFPLLHTRLSLMDLRTGELVGYGYVSECYFTRKRVMGVVVLSPLMWDPQAPLYE